jgi:hypothetical protein
MIKELFILSFIFNISSKVRNFYVNSLTKLFDYESSSSKSKESLFCTHQIIEKQSLILTENGIKNMSDCETSDHHTLEPSIDLFMSGIEAIVEDDVLTFFKEQNLERWNFLTRYRVSSKSYKFKVDIIWLFGVILRYAILLPARVMLLSVGTIYAITFPIVMFLLPESTIKKKFGRNFMILNAKLLSKSVITRLEFHDTEYRPKSGICVANHTTPLDTVFLMQDNLLSITGQRHGGFLGILQKATENIPSIFIDRSKANERLEMSRR